jgi:hypothetical protein
VAVVVALTTTEEPLADKVLELVLAALVVLVKIQVARHQVTLQAEAVVEEPMVVLQAALDVKAFFTYFASN